MNRSPRYPPHGRGNRGRGSGGRDPHFHQRRFNGTGITERMLILLVIAVVVGVTVGVILPKVSPPIGQLTGEYTVSGPAGRVLDELRIDDHPNGAGYDRQAFGYRQTDVDGDGCDIREDVLARDLNNVVMKRPGGCQVLSGVLNDPYTGKTIHFVRGVKTSKAVQIDHVVALQNAWQSGAKKWNVTKRYQFGNDAYNMLAVDGPSNEEKGSASAAYWLPTNSTYRCSYVARQIGVKKKYDLSITKQEKRAMQSVLHGCPAQEIPNR